MISQAIEFYYKATKLKDALRQGAVVWNVSKPRMESIAEHTFGCMILAVALHSELNLDLDLGKVLEMITIHELEELSIGDITPLSKVKKEDVKDKARESVVELVKAINTHEHIMDLTDDFNLHNSKEAKFAHAIDKLENVLEFKKYQDNDFVSLDNVTEEMLQNEKLKEYVDAGVYDLADIFFLFHKSAYEEFGITEEFWFNTLKNLKID